MRSAAVRVEPDLHLLVIDENFGVLFARKTLNERAETLGRKVAPPPSRPYQVAADSEDFNIVAKTRHMGVSTNDQSAQSAGARAHRRARVAEQNARIRANPVASAVLGSALIRGSKGQGEGGERDREREDRPDLTVFGASARKASTHHLQGQ